MKTRILSILLIVLMLFTTVAMTGCSSYTFHNKRYAEELSMLTNKTFTGMDISVEVKDEDMSFLDAYYGVTSMEKYLDENIRDSLRALTYKDADKKTVAFMGTDKPLDKNIALDDDAAVYYLIKLIDEEKSIVKQFYNLANVISAKDIGSGNLYGVNFEKALVEAGIGSEGTRGTLDAKTSGYVYTTDGYKHVTDDEAATESTGYDVWYITLKAQKWVPNTETDDPDDGSYADNLYLQNAYGADYDGKSTIRVDLKNIDFDAGTGKTDADGNKLVPDEIAAIVKQLVDNQAAPDDDPETEEVDESVTEKDKFKIGATFGLKDFVIGENKYEISGKLERAQKEQFGKSFEVTLDTSAKAITDTELLGKKVSVEVIVTEVKEYNINADISEFCVAAGWKDAEGKADFKELLLAIDSSFSTDKTQEADKNGTKLTQAELIAEYKSYIKTSNYERIESELISGAKDAFFTAIVAIAQSGIADDAYPKSAVKQCYREALNNAKTTYSQYYSTAYDSFEAYFTKQYGVADYDTALVEMEKECKEIVLEKMVIMRLAGIMGITVTKSEYKAEVEKLEKQYAEILSFYQAYRYTDADNVVEYLGGEENIYIAMYYSRIMNKIYDMHFKDIKDIPRTRAGS